MAVELRGRGALYIRQTCTQCVACNRTHVFLDANQINSIMIVLLVSLLVLVLVILFVPGAEPMTKLVLLSTLLIAVIAYSIYVLVTGKDSPAPAPSPTPSSNNGNGNGSCPPSYCKECDANPCRCAEVIPNQKECPKCRGLLGASPAEGIQSCHQCGRCYRCPGCLLQ